MRKIIILTIFAGLSLSASAQVRVGGFLAYGADIEQIGLGVNAEFFATDRLSIAPGLLFYFPDTDSGIRYSYWELNGNVNYYLLTGDFAGLYGIAGLNLTRARVESDDNILNGAFDRSDSDLGLNLGVGFNFTIGNIRPFVEGKYVIGDINQPVLMAGLIFSIFD